MSHLSSDLKIFLHDPKPWSASSGTKPESILPTGSARYCKQSLTTEAAGPTFYPPNSDEAKTYALDPNLNAHKKYTATIECEDHYLPAYGELWPQTPVWLYSTVRMMVLCVAKIPVGLKHDPVPDSLIFHDADGTEKPLDNAAWKASTRHVVHDASGFISYAPILNMAVQKMTLCSKEWEACSTWKLELREV